MIPQPAGARATAALSFDDLTGWAEDDHAEAFACFRISAESLSAGCPALRPALPDCPALLRIARAALALPPSPTRHAARRFFERCFTPVLVAGKADAFFTGYYEPEVEGVLEPSASFTAPLLARPDDLKTFAADEARPAALAGFAAARIGPDGALSPYPDRAAIEAAALLGEYRPVVWLRDWVEVFLIQVQGSARVRLPDGRRLRLTYAGRNGHPYTSIGKILAEQGAVAPGAMSLDRLKDWLRASGQAPGQRGRAVMQRNASYIFFEASAEAGQGGPIGGQGIALTPLRSIAVDRGLWSYGLPFWIDADLPWRSAGAEPFRRLMVAQDTGSAVLGAARADIFFGSGEAAGRRAGDIRHHGGLVILRPNPSAESLA